METTLQTGDNLLVFKMIPGPRVFNIIQAIKGERISIRRLPISHLQRNDIIVFNYPYANNWNFIQFDVMKYYVKRCIGLPGDSLSIQNGYYHINGISIPLGNLDGQRDISLQSKNYLEQAHLFNSYPEDTILNWNVKDFGPLYIPRKDDIITMNRTNTVLYHKLIEWEQQCSLRLDSVNRVFLNEQLIHEYQFRQNYYFVAGDRAVDSQDSRYWGLLPEEFIVGKAWLIWKSVDPYTGEFRWDRFLKVIN